MTAMIARRTLLASALSVAALPRLAFAADLASAVSDLAVGNRSTKLHMWRPAKPRGIALLSTGHGAWPERYTTRLIPMLLESGWAVFAPVHVDSMRHPDRARFSMQASFGERLADLRTASRAAVAVLPGLPIVAVGHSFGTLIGLCGGGGLAKIGPFRMPELRAVLGFSTPGRIPGLIQPDAYGSVDVPVMIVTGSKDVLPPYLSYPSKPEDHLLAVETSKRASYAVVVDGGEHGLVDQPLFARAEAAARLFLRAHGRGDDRAARALNRWRAPAPDRFIVRGI